MDISIQDWPLLPKVADIRIWLSKFGIGRSLHRNITGGMFCLVWYAYHDIYRLCVPLANMGVAIVYQVVETGTSKTS